ncbi:MAG: histidine phosphatase family protein [Spirochaetes bacterium]|nr:histidine phosphatase family protein [Spirochaetota bacterium]
MKTIQLMRHGKSDWSNPAAHDTDRPLSKRGIKDAVRKGRTLVRFGRVPDWIVSSPTLRAMQTAEIVAEECRLLRPLVIDEPLYQGETGDVLRAIRHLPGEIERPLIVGHNPTIEETAGLLLSGGRGNAIKFPTAALVCFLYDSTPWGSFDPGGCTLLLVSHPPPPQGYRVISCGSRPSWN